MEALIGVLVGALITAGFEYFYGPKIQRRIRADERAEEAYEEMLVLLHRRLPEAMTKMKAKLWFMENLPMGAGKQLPMLRDLRESAGEFINLRWEYVSLCRLSGLAEDAVMFKHNKTLAHIGASVDDWLEYGVEQALWEAEDEARKAAVERVNALLAIRSVKPQRQRKWKRFR